MKMLCVICDRPVCGHNIAARYMAEPAEYTPVETANGEHVRQAALRLLGDRYRVLLDNSKTYSFSPIEGTMLDDTGRVLEILAAMKPTGPLIPNRGEGYADAVLS